MKTMKIPALLLALTFSASFASAESCFSPRLENFAAYAIGSMDVRNSDHEGLSGAGRDLYAEHFLFEGRKEQCQALSVGGLLDFRDGTAGDTVEATQVQLTRVNLLRGQSESIRPGVYRSTKARRTRINFLNVDHRLLTQDLLSASQQMGAWAPNLTPKVDGSVLTVELGTGTGVVSLAASDFKKGATLVLKGSPRNHLVLNIRGSRVVLDGLNVVLEGGLRPSQIRWNFVEASTLFIVRTHDPALGIPGILMAPFADTQFYEGLITGSLWVKNLIYDPNCGFKHSGQINKDRTPAAKHDCLCSQP